MDGGGRGGDRGRGPGQDGGPRGGNFGGPGGTTYAIPAEKCGLVIGKGMLAAFLQNKT